MEAGVVSRSFDRLRVHSIGLPQVLFQYSAYDHRCGILVPLGEEVLSHLKEVGEDLRRYEPGVVVSQPPANSFRIAVSIPTAYSM